MSERSVSLEVTPHKISAGDTVNLTLTNRSALPLGYNLCTSSLERRSESTWQLVPSDRICTMEIRTLPPGQQTRYQLKTPSGLSAGEDRYTAQLDRQQAGNREAVSTEPFQVHR